MNITANEAWEKLFNKYSIIEEVNNNNIYHISASNIKEFKEPRLMSKWDSSVQLPQIFKKNHINILPTSRSSYVLGDFLLYENIPELKEHVLDMSTLNIPDYETIDVDNITSESVSINILIISGILDDFLNEKNNVQTFNGRMGTGEFDFTVNNNRKTKTRISVKNAQCEVDGGFENDNSVVILEAKNVVHDDFHIRQLYYPYRLWLSKVKKPIRLVFSIYSNKIFRLFEYEFEDKNNYSSINLIQSKNYSLEEVSISNDELYATYKNTKVRFNDDMGKNLTIPFIQADKFDRVISILENLYRNPMNDEEISELMNFSGSQTGSGSISYRQSQYYYNAGKYLGLFCKSSEASGEKTIKLTQLGNSVYSMSYKQRQLKLVSLILEHKIFNELFYYSYINGEIAPKEKVIFLMKKHNVCSEKVMNRRATSVIRWLEWIFNLSNL